MIHNIPETNKVLNENEKKGRKTFRHYNFYILLFTLIVFGGIVYQIDFFIISTDHEKNQLEGKIIPITSLVKTSTNSAISKLKPINDANLPICDEFINSVVTKKYLKNINRKFRFCASGVLQRFTGNPESLFYNWNSTYYICDNEPIMLEFDVRRIENSENRIYNVVMPKCNEPAIVVTLGISENVEAEEKLTKIFKEVQFYGTSQYLNSSNIYSIVHNVAIDNKNGSLEIEVVNGNNSTKTKTISKMDPIKFFTKTLALPQIDILWINVDSGTFDFDTWFYGDGLLEGYNIQICQINMELTRKNENSFFRTMEHLYRLGDRMYIAMRPTMTEDEQIIRVLFVNIKSPYCIRKYVY